MKKFLIFIVIIAAIYAAVKLSIKSPDQSIPSATENAAGINGTPSANPTSMPPSGTPSAAESIAADRISVAFTGYGPGGKLENGTVKAKESTLSRTGSAFTGSVVFDMNSIVSVPVKDSLIMHLKGADFFNVATYPTATFAITSATDTQINGTLTMKGTTKPVTLPVAYDGMSNAYSSTVRVNMEDFGIKQTFTDKEFLLKITVK